MGYNASSDRRSILEERSSKRSRPSEPLHLFAPQRQPFTHTTHTPPRQSRPLSSPYPNASASKRKRSPLPSQSDRKRRHPVTACSPTKKPRSFTSDVEMIDVFPDPSAPAAIRFKRHQILKNVMRKERINRFALRPLVANLADSNIQQQTTLSHQQTAPRCESPARTHVSDSPPSYPVRHPPFIATSEEHVEELDISQCSEINKERPTNSANSDDPENPLIAHLMEDGRCFIRITRPDGRIDYYTLHPHASEQED